MRHLSSARKAQRPEPAGYDCNSTIVGDWDWGRLERVKGIEPSSFGWEPKALPLSYTRVARRLIQPQGSVKGPPAQNAQNLKGGNLRET